MPDNADLIAWLRDERRLCPPSEWLRATDAAAAALEAADERIAALNERHAAFVKLNTAMFDNVARERDTARERIAALEAQNVALRKTLAGIAPTLPGATIGPTTYFAARAALKEQTP